VIDSSALDPNHQGSAAGLLTLRVMQFNIELGGEGVDFSSVARAIVASDAQVVAIQEACGRMPQIASDLGWAHYDVRSQVVSKFPLLTPSDAAEGAILVEVVQGQVIAIINVHPPSRGYGPSRVERGVGVGQVLRRERKVRLASLRPQLDYAAKLLASRIPVVLLGDFNAPSHHDWSLLMVGAREHLRYPVEWPTSMAAEEMGLSDVYRVMFPDPTTHPGLTWPASRPFVPGYNPARADKPSDRIDLMYVGGPVTPKAVSIVGETESAMTDIDVTPWPSDHRAIVARLDVLPAPTPTIISVDRRLVDVGQPIEVRYHAGDDDAARLRISPTDTASARVGEDLQLPDPRTGRMSLPTDALSTGSYVLDLLAANERLLSTTRVWIVDANTPPLVTCSTGSYVEGEPVVVSWDCAPGNKADWVCIVKTDDAKAGPALIWTYTKATVAGVVTFDETSRQKEWPLPAGDYAACLVADDSQRRLAIANFTINPR
jgi:endonuclease/exonuclease/phosphatase family metal-dependent hydrolase